jgi:hypothetical protein
MLEYFYSLVLLGNKNAHHDATYLEFLIADVQQNEDTTKGPAAA